MGTACSNGISVVTTYQSCKCEMRAGSNAGLFAAAAAIYAKHGSLRYSSNKLCHPLAVPSDGQHCRAQHAQYVVNCNNYDQVPVGDMEDAQLALNCDM